MLIIPNNILKLSELQNATAKTLRVASYIIGICLQKGFCEETNADLTREFNVSSDGIGSLLKILTKNNCIEVNYNRSNARRISLKQVTLLAIKKEILQVSNLLGYPLENGEGIRIETERVSASKRRGYPRENGEGIRVETDTPLLKQLKDSYLTAAENSPAIEEKNAESVGFPQTPFLDISNIINNNNINISTAPVPAHTYTREEKNIITPYVTICKLRKTADELFVRGIPQKHSTAFCIKFNGFDFDSNETLTKALKEFYKSECNAAKEQTKTMTFGDRKEKFSTQVREQQQKDPGAFPELHYSEFIEYWTVPMINETKDEKITDRTPMRFECEKTFSISARLSWSYKNIYLKHHPHGSDKSKSVPYNNGTGKPATSSKSRKAGFVDLEAAILAKARRAGDESEGRIIDTAFEHVE